MGADYARAKREDQLVVDDPDRRFFFRARNTRGRREKKGKVLLRKTPRGTTKSAKNDRRSF